MLYRTCTDSKVDLEICMIITLSVDLVAAAEHHPAKVTEMLNTVKVKEFEKNDLEQALNICARNGALKPVCHLLCKGVTNLAYALEISAQQGHYNITALLALARAVIKDDLDRILYVFGDSHDEYDYYESYLPVSLLNSFMYASQY